jgi:hypothetical protein
MVMETSDLASLSQMLLVACDQSYGAPQLIPNVSFLSRLDDPPLNAEFTPPFNTDFPNFRVAFAGGDPASGFKYVIYQDRETREVIVAMAGTDGTDLRDWWSNVTHYGWNQWSRNRVTVFQQLEALIGQLGGINRNEAKIYFTGQSLGGALAEYAAYEFAELHNSYPANNLALVTFNALGSVAALRAEIPNREQLTELGSLRFTDDVFQPARASAFGTITHYGSLNDLVWRVGGGHLGEHIYNFAGIDFSHVHPENDEPYLLDAISAHRIETGFYFPLERFAEIAVLGFNEAIEKGPLSTQELAGSYLKLDHLQKTASILGNLFRQDSTSKTGAMVKLLFGGLGSFAFGEPEEVNELVRAYVQSRSNAGLYEDKEAEYDAAMGTDWALRLKIAAATLGLSVGTGFSPFGLLMKLVTTIALAPVYQLLEGVRNDDGDFVLRASFLLDRQGASLPNSRYEDTLQRSSLIGAAVDIKAPGDLRLDNIAELTRDDLDGFANAMAVDTNWRSSVSGYILRRGNALGKQDLAQSAGAEFWAYSLNAAQGNPTMLAEVQS